MAGSGGSGLLEQPNHLALVGMALQRLLREYTAPIHLYLEHAARRLDELDLRLGKDFADLGRQTGSPWLIVSDDAEFDRHAHDSRISTLDTPRHTSDLAR
jgi:hypothetical protein